MKFKPFRVKRRRIPPTVLSDICLIVHGTELLHAKHQNLIAQPEESVYRVTPIELAQAAKRLLPHITKRQKIALALPSSEFVATTLNLPAAAIQNINNVVNLQLPTLLPGVTEPLLLAVQPPDDGEQTCALWIPIKRADELFQAFDKEGLFLSCILPRPVVVLPATKIPCQVYDEDDKSITHLEWSGEIIQRWLYIAKEENEVEEFKTQLEETLSIFKNDIKQKHKTNVDDWKNLPIPPPAAYGYAFIPSGAAARIAQTAKLKKRRSLSSIVILFIIGIGVGIYIAIDYEQRLKQHLTELRKRTNNVSHLGAEVAEIEENIGPIKNFPRQQVVNILNTLNKLIPKNSWITSCHIEGGIIKLEGYSPNPTQLIEILTAEPRFMNPKQSRETRKEKGRIELSFGIDFKLRDFDLGTYWLEYFPKKRY